MHTVGKTVLITVIVQYFLYKTFLVVFGGLFYIQYNYVV